MNLPVGAASQFDSLPVFEEFLLRFSLEGDVLKSQHVSLYSGAAVVTR
jgi:hypothetical protein